MFRVGLLLIIKKYYSVYTAVVSVMRCVDWLLAGSGLDLDPANTTHDRYNCCIYRVVPPDDEH